MMSVSHLLMYMYFVSQYSNNIDPDYIAPLFAKENFEKYTHTHTVCLLGQNTVFIQQGNILTIFLFPLTRHCFTGMGRSVENFSNWILIKLNSVKPVLRGHSEKTENCLIFQDRLSLNAGQNISECSSILQYLRPAFSAHLSLLFISLSGRFRQVLLYSPTIGNKIKYTNNLLRSYCLHWTTL